jgi:acetyltransferase-like isoleucine patch superfamily enzyme
MSYYTKEQLERMGFEALGRNVKISNKSSFYNRSSIKIGDNSRVDDFCVISGRVEIGRNVHITPQCLLAGGEKGLVIEDFVALSYGVKVFTQSDDYSGETMTNSTVPKKYKNELKHAVRVGRHSIIGAGSIILPGVVVGEGVSIGANSLVLESTENWSIYVGSPAKRIKSRKKDLLKLEQEYLGSEK